ncbi:MAG TPA: DUF1127 domain-containing protein [Casimicrobiaceae bacterium]|nr:DUF1127 domain-containing protein [Casimicrobiaceae bacterium]
MDKAHRLQPPRTDPADAFLAAAASAFERLAASGSRARSWYRRRRVAAETYETLRSLDDRCLRDLGLDRMELRSAAAEAAGQAERTRLQVFPRIY